MLSWVRFEYSRGLSPDLMPAGRQIRLTLSSRLERVMKTSIAAFFVVLFLLTGCAHVGVDSFAPGHTTEAELRAKLGAPGMVWTEADGSRLLEFSGQPSGTFCYMITVGPDGKLREIRHAFSEDNLRRVVAGLTQDETRRLLGVPEEKVRFALKPDEEVWSWSIEDTTEKTVYFNAYFGTDGRLLRSDRSVFYKASGPSFSRSAPQGYFLRADLTGFPGGVKVRLAPI